MPTFKKRVPIYMVKSKKFRGTYVPTTTPFTSKDKLDKDGLRSNIDWLIEQGVHGIICSGSTGEPAQLTEDERKDVIFLTVNYVNERVPVLAGTGAPSTWETIKWTKYAKDVGADGAMIINPWYAAPDQEELYQHFKAVVEAVDIPIMLYNNVSVSGVDVKAPTIARMADANIIRHIKDSSGDILRISEIRLHVGDRVTVFYGGDGFPFEAFMIGAEGWVTALGNIVPKMASELFTLAVDKRDIDAARKLYVKMAALCRFINSNTRWIQRVKAGLDLMGQSGGPLRKPRLSATAEEKAELRKILKDLKIV
jgi:4-hydroxy-tetrahydrodipicolinate synthase